VTSTASPIDQVRAALGGEYEILRLLGQGGMAAVYLAREKALKRLVAIKVLDPELGASSVFRTRFQREAETAAQLQHPNIVPIYRVGEQGGLSFFTMAYVEGGSLAELRRRDGRVPVAETLRIAREVAAALGSAHRRGIIHRDVKPQNVLLDRESGRALVTDFGIARSARPSAPPPIPRAIVSPAPAWSWARRAT
jgi:eukaryotic-like serine/threonine-protein kinase